MGDDHRNDRDGAVSESLAESILAHLGPDVRLLEQETQEGAFEDSDAALPLGRLAAEYAEGFVHPDADDAADMGDAGHTSLSVARSLPKGLGEDDPGDDDDHGAEPAHAEHAARPPEKPGRDALDYLRARIRGEAKSNSHWAGGVAREHEQPAHALIARLFQALIPAAYRGGFAEIEGIVGLVELVATKAPLDRFYSEPAGDRRHVIEDADTVTVVGNCVFGDFAAMMSALLNGDVVDALARRQEVLARLDLIRKDAKASGGVA